MTLLGGARGKKKLFSDMHKGGGGPAPTPGPSAGQQRRGGTGPKGDESKGGKRREMKREQEEDGRKAGKTKGLKCPELQNAHLRRNLWRTKVFLRFYLQGRVRSAHALSKSASYLDLFRKVLTA